MPAPAHRRRPAHYAAPAAFLAAVTIAVLLIRAGLGGGGPATSATTTLGPVAHTTTASAGPHKKRHRKKGHPAVRYYVVQSGDTFGSIAAKERTTVARLEQLNPHVDSGALAVGERIRVK